MIKITKHNNSVYKLAVYADNEELLRYEDSVTITKDSTLDETSIKKILIMKLLHDNYEIIVDELVDKIQVEYGT
jgi:hypothetical protein